MRRIYITAVAIGALLGFTKAIWQSGFDQGADVSLCVVASFQRYGEKAVRVDPDDSSCQRAKGYERNPLWLLRRRGGD